MNFWPIVDGIILFINLSGPVCSDLLLKFPKAKNKFQKERAEIVDIGNLFFGILKDKAYSRKLAPLNHFRFKHQT